jgi:hypothetical protein
MSLWAGQSAALAQSRSARDYFDELVREVGRITNESRGPGWSAGSVVR